MANHKEKLCEICGGYYPGFEYLLATCTTCGSTCEHVYCMRKVQLEVPEDWVCESCLSGNDMILTESDAEEGDQLSLTLSQYQNYLPALHTSWRGGFSIVDSSTYVEFLGGFHAKPPCRVHRKAHELSLQMPIVLQVKLLPRFQIWAELFQNNCPDLQDIALYFFPSDNTEKSRQNNAQLFERLDIQNSVMISYINGVELLIFTSRQLNLNSKYVMERSEAEHFLWGVFRNANNNKALDKDDNETAEMEIETIGGKALGKAGIAFAKDSLTCGLSELETIQDSALKMLDEQVSAHSKDMDSTAQKMSQDVETKESKNYGTCSTLIKNMKSEIALEDSELVGTFKNHDPALIFVLRRNSKIY